MKDVRIVDGTDRGPILVRGGRIDGDGAMEFSFNPVTPRRDALVLDESAPSFQGSGSTGVVERSDGSLRPAIPPPMPKQSGHESIAPSVMSFDPEIGAAHGAGRDLPARSVL